MRIGSLFAGIGGFDLAACWMGWSTAWVSEIDPYASRVLAHHFPEAPNLGDITTVEWGGVERPDVLCGGFPCQPNSIAGRRSGLTDTRWLWPAFRDSIGTLRPDWVVGENVLGLLDVNGGRGFASVLRDLAALGYDAEWGCIAADAAGAAHQRDRVWLVAYPMRERREGLEPHQRLLGRTGATLAQSRHRAAFAGLSVAASGACLRERHGVSIGMDRRCLHGLGNAIVPQVAYAIFSAIAQVEKQHP